MRPPIGKRDPPEREPAGAQRRFGIVIEASDLRSRSQQKRKRIEEPFGWGKIIGGLARPMLRGIRKLGFKFTLTMAGYNLIR
ncbi:MAG TPA: hypothetical protein VKC66_28610, partial [Xanthobacteraceae bacterium]|nr:hypothetical protein [Xanthobacteraceae bacterium]